MVSCQSQSSNWDLFLLAAASFGTTEGDGDCDNHSKETYESSASWGQSGGRRTLCQELWTKYHGDPPSLGLCLFCECLLPRICIRLMWGSSSFCTVCAQNLEFRVLLCSILGRFCLPLLCFAGALSLLWFQCSETWLCSQGCSSCGVLGLLWRGAVATLIHFLSTPSQLKAIVAIIGSFAIMSLTGKIRTLPCAATLCIRKAASSSRRGMLQTRCTKP